MTVALIVVILLIAILIYGSYNFIADLFNRLPPGPIPVPFLGTIKLRKKDRLKPWKYFAQHGGISTHYYGQFRTVVINDFKIMQQALLDRSQPLINRPDFGPTSCRLFKLVNTANGDLWKQLRRFSVQAMRNFGMGKPAMVDAILGELGYLFKTLDDNNCASDLLFYAASANILAPMFLGKRFDYCDDQFLNLIQTVQDFNYCDDVFVFMVPMLRNFKLPSSTKMLRKTKDLTMEILEAAIKHSESSAMDLKSPKDFIELYLTENFPIDLNLEAFSAFVADLYGNAIDASGNNINWCLLYLAKFPEIQKRCREELARECGFNHPVTLDDRERLRYLEATILESYRMSVTAPLALPHATLETGALIDGFEIPPKTMVRYNIWAVHHDQAYWKDPEVFRPERFLNEEDGSVLKHHGHFIPFGIGARSCLGEPLAKQLQFLFIASMLQRYKWRLEVDVDLDAGASVSFHAPPRFRLVTKRIVDN